MSRGTQPWLPIGIALLAATLFGLNAPAAKLLLADFSPLYLTALLYLGAGLGIGGLKLLSGRRRAEAALTRDDLPWVALMVVLDVLAPFLLLLGLARTTAENASLLLNFEMVATSVIAWLGFHEAIGRRMWLAMMVITLAGMVLSVDFSKEGTFTFSLGSLLVIGGCCCWGLENNCTRNLSAKDPAQIVIIKGLGSGFTALLIALLCEPPGAGFRWSWVPAALLLGFVAYGLSIDCYVRAQRRLGAARTSVYYAAAPFIGAALSLGIFREPPSRSLVAGGVLMVCGALLAVTERHQHRHRHERLVHEHRHTHDDRHHTHSHPAPVTGYHSHRHTHEELVHDHPHTPDLHHRHRH